MDVMTRQEFRAYRISLSFSQVGLSKFLGCSPTSIIEWENGSTRLNKMAATALKREVERRR